MISPEQLYLMLTTFPKERRLKRLFTLLAFSAAAIFAEPHTHDGFFLNLQTGLGYYGQDSKYASDDFIEINTFAANFSIKLGGAPTPYVTLYGICAVSSGTDSVQISALDETTLTLGQAFLAPGILLFPFREGPLDNLHLGVAAGLAVDFLQSDDYDIRILDGNGNLAWTDGFSTVGFGLQMEVGKEWWISDNWSMGVAAVYRFSAGESDEDPFEIRSRTIQIQFTVSRS